MNGTIPVPWNLTSLQHVDLSRNALSGPLEPLLTPAIGHLGLSHNPNLTGSWSGLQWDVSLPQLHTLRLTSVGIAPGSLPVSEPALPVAHPKNPSARARAVSTN